MDRIIILDRDIVPGSTKYVDPGTHLVLENQDVPFGWFRSRLS